MKGYADLKAVRHSLKTLQRPREPRQAGEGEEGGDGRQAGASSSSGALASPPQLLFLEAAAPGAGSKEKKAEDTFPDAGRPARSRHPETLPAGSGLQLHMTEAANFMNYVNQLFITVNKTPDSWFQRFTPWSTNSTALGPRNSGMKHFASRHWFCEYIAVV
ncbi:uncharacterized protein LOC144375743 [Ictidomys tridecemlineatus]